MSSPDLLDPRDPDPRSQRALSSWLALQRALGLQPQRAAETLRRCGGPEAALLSAGVQRPSRRQLAADLAALRRAEAVALPLLFAGYPPRLAALSDPPPLLWVRGDPAVLSAPGVAIVGSRAASAYGLAVARRLAADLARAGLVVISGLARGVDAAAHRGALEAGGRTLAFQACGPDRVYPAGHGALAAQIASSGALATEHPPGTPPRAPYFPLRNRLLTGAALALVVVEARERSGSLTSAGHAAGQDLDVFAVPGRVDAPTSAGANRLLHEGAFVARDAADVLSLLEQRGHWRRQEGLPRAGGDPAPADGRILRALDHAPASRDELARRLGCAPQDLALELLQLELAGLVVEDRDGLLRRQRV